MKSWKNSFVALLLFDWCGCAQLATVKKVEPRIPAIAASEGELTLAKEHLATGERAQPLVALGDDISTAKTSLDVLEQRPNDSTAQNMYNFSVARAVENIERAKIQPWRQPVNVVTDKGNYILTSPKPVDQDHDPSRYDLIPADTLTIGGKFLPTRSTVTGVGAPLVAAGRTENPDSRQRSPVPRVLHRIYAPVTALLIFHGRQVSLEFLDPLETEHVSFAKHQMPLAADFTAPTAIGMTREHPEKLGFERLVRPEKYQDVAPLMRLQPYDRKRIPVILVHGLGDAPVTWIPMINTLRSDPEIRRRYQFWFFSYPSGYPFPYSAALFRRQLNVASRAFPNHKGIVLIGHSMGGLVSRLMVTDAGDKIWRYYFGKPPAQTILPSESRKALEECFVFNHRPEIKRVIFVSTPHRGSPIASSWIGRFGTRLVNIQKLGTAVPPSIFSEIMVADPSAAELKHVPTSIDTLQPNDRFVREMNKFPIVSSVPFHTIEGDRGRGDAPHSSDGVVPYWSSHLDGAQSELIVPSDHRAQRNPQAIREVERILKLNLAAAR